MGPEPDGLLTIGQAAEQSGATTSALRFYEKQGLVVPRARAVNSYRLYDDEQVARVRFIRQAQRLGLSLAEVAELLTAVDCDDPAPTRERLRHLVSHKLISARRQIAGLQEFARQLERIHIRLASEPGCGCKHLGSCGCLPLEMDGAADSERELAMVDVGCNCGCASFA